MDGDRFEALARLVTASSRRGALRCLAGAVLALGWVTRRPAGGLARKRKRKPAFNAFGCVPVGKPCRGKNGVCCSGVCQGKKPKKGKPDRSRCAAHNTGGCLAAEQGCGPNPDVPCGAGGLCLATTGNAGFCGRVQDAACAACRRDADCPAATFGAGAACVVCRNGSCPETGDRACVPAAA